MARRRWSQESIIDAIRLHAALTGDPPTSREWHSPRRPSYAPTAATVKDFFGSWNAGIVAAGFKPRPRGIPGHLIPLERGENGHLLPR